MNVQAEGTVYPDVPFVVEPDRVRSFRELFGSPDGVVPPTFATAAEFLIFPMVIADQNLALDFSRVLHGDQEYRYERELVEGETLTVRSHIASIRERAGTGFLTLVCELFDSQDRLVVTCRSMMIERAA